MLILTRKPGEKLEIGDGIEVVIVSVCGGKVRIGIQADRSVPIVRGELRRGRNQSDPEPEGGKAA